MFSKKAAVEKSFTNLISHGTKIIGNVRFCGVIRIEGQVEGDVITDTADDNENNIPTGSAVICSGALVTSDLVRAHNISIGGEGVSIVHAKKIWCENSLEILRGAQVSGATIYYRNLRIEPGALVHGCVLKHLDHCSEGEHV